MLRLSGALARGLLVSGSREAIPAPAQTAVAGCSDHPLVQMVNPEVPRIAEKVEAASGRLAVPMKKAALAGLEAYSPDIEPLAMDSAQKRTLG